jgi:hypothetical protein
VALEHQITGPANPVVQAVVAQLPAIQLMDQEPQDKVITAVLPLHTQEQTTERLAPEAERVQLGVVELIMLLLQMAGQGLFHKLLDHQFNMLAVEEAVMVPEQVILYSLGGSVAGAAVAAVMELTD